MDHEFSFGGACLWRLGFAFRASSGGAMGCVGRSVLARRGAYEHAGQVSDQDANAWARAITTDAGNTRANSPIDTASASQSGP